MIGVDTGFFVELMNGNEEAIRLWKACLNDEEEIAVSCLSLFEIERLGLKGTLKDWEAIQDAVHGVTFVVWMDREILSQAARLSRGMGIPAMDSLILASLVSQNVHEIYTTDSDFLAYQSKDVVVRNLRKH